MPDRRLGKGYDDGMTVHVRRAPPVVVVTIDRPSARNAVDGPTARALAAAVRAFEEDPDLSVCVLTGAGGHFCAGADLKAVASGDPERANPVHPPTGEPFDVGPMGPTRFRLSKPVIAAIEGSCVAGGLELALFCDLRVAGAGAVFGVFCRRFGVPLIDGGTVRLPRAIGASRAMDLVLTGRAVDAEEALAIGLVNRLVPEGGALAAAEALAQELAALPQACLRSDRRSALDQWTLDEPAALARELELGFRSLASGEAGAGAARFRDGAGRGGRGL